MEIELIIIAPDGSVRTVTVRPGDTVEIAPGETVVLSPDSAATVDALQDGETLVLETAEGNIELDGFFTAVPEGELPTAIGFQDENGFTLITNQGTFVSQSFTALSAEGFSLPEGAALPEAFLPLDGGPRGAALRQVLAGFLPEEEEDNNASGAGGSDDPAGAPSADGVEIFAGSLDQGPAIFSIEPGIVEAREGQVLTVTITRSGNLRGTDTLDFRTVLGAGDTASAGDFAAQNGTLTFMPNETRKTVSIALTQDAPSPEPTETFTFEILNPRTSRASGAVQLDTDTVRLSIQNNELPINTTPGAQITNEDTPIVFTGPTVLSVADADGAPLTVTLSVTNGTLTLGATPPGVTVAGNGTGAVSLTGTPAALNAALDGTTYSPRTDFSGTDTLVMRSDDGAAVDTDAVGITVNVVQDAPILNAAATPVLNAVLEEAGAPVGAVGTAVSALVDPVGGGGLDNVTDPDGPALGIAVTFLDTTDGTWFFSIDDGASWNPVGVVDNANSLLLSTVGGRLYFQPTTVDFSGTVTGAAVFRAWDQSTGVNGTKVDTSVSGTPTAFSATSDSANLTVTNINDAPVLNAAAAPVLQAVDEDAPAPAGAVGTAVSALVDLTGGGGLDNVADPDGPLLGVAVTALDTTNGQWWFSTDNGASWSLTGAVSNVNALLLSAAGGRLFFQSTTAEFSGVIANALTYRAWDGFTGTNGAKADTSVNGDPTAFSTATETLNLTVTAINDTPVNTAPASVNALEDVAFDFTGGNTVSVADTDAGLNPLAVTMTVGSGDILFTAGTLGLTGDVDGTDGTVSFAGTIASINSALAGLRYLGNSGFSGTDTLTITTSDQGFTGADPGLTGGPADEQDVSMVTINVAGVNDTPVLNAAATPVLMAVNEDAAMPMGAVGTAVSALVDLPGGGGLDNVTDPDGPGVGIAITNLDTTNGQWWFSTDNGMSWSPVGAVTGTSALLLSGATGRLYFQPTTAHFNGTIANAVTFHAWDGFTNGTFTGTNGMKFDPTTAGAESPFSVATDTAAITVTAINDTPVNTAPASVNALENIAFDFTGGNAVSIADVDAGASALSVTMTVANGDILFTAGTTGLAGDVDGTDGTVSFTGNLTNINNALAGLRYLGGIGFSGVDTLTITTSDQGATGLDPGLTGGPADEQDVDAITINVAGLNDTPVLNAAATPVLAALDEDAGAPAGAVGTAVSALVDLTGGGGLDNVTDPDGPGVGIAVTSLDTTNGQWWFSTNNGGSWSLVGGVAANNALLLAGTNGRLYFEPNANFNGTIANAVTFHAWDGFTNGTFTGTNGTKFDPTTAGMESPFSVGTDTAAITVNSINDAPVNTAPASINATEDTPFDFTGGNAVSIADVDAGGSPLSVTMTVGNGDILFTAGTTGLAGDVDGTDGTVSFTGTLASINAALAGLRYLGDTDFSGADTLTITTNDQGATGADPGLTGGPADEQDVDIVNITVTGDNDSPTLNAAATPVLVAVNEDAAPPAGAVGTAVSALVDLTGGGGLDNVSDPDGPALGLAVTGLNTTNGQWWFSTNNGGTWSLVGAVSNTNALLLSATAGRLYFDPTTPNFNGTIANAVTFKAWDQFTNVNWTGTNGNKTDTTLAFLESPFSAVSDTASITVSPVNDTPVNTAPASVNALEDIAFDFTGGNAVSIADLDAGASALSVTMTVGSGDILFTAGTTGLAGDVDGTDGTVSFTGNLTNINNALSGLRYLGNNGFSGVDTLTITTSDQGATGLDPGLTGGPADEQDVSMVTINVAGLNDTPVLNAAATPVLAALDEDAGAPVGAVGTAVSALVDLTGGGGLDNVTDPDGPGVGIAVTALDTTNGQWWFSTDNGGSWSLVGGVAANNALLLAGTDGRLYFEPNANFNGTIANAVTFHAWDGFTNGTFTGTNGTKFDPTTAGMESPFSVATDTAAVTVNSINDTPMHVIGNSSVTTPEDIAFDFTGLDAISLVDPDAGANPLSVTMTVGSGDILFTAGTTGLAGDVDGTDGTVSFTGTVANINAALAGLRYLGNLDFSGIDSLTITTNDQGFSGTDPGLTGGPADEQDMDVVTITVAGQNDTPLLNMAATPVLAAVNEDAPVPAGAVGTAVSALVDLTGGGGLDNVTDPDGLALGVAVTALDTANGQWWFSTNGGTSWSLVGAVSDTNALLLSATNGRLYFQPTTLDFNGTIANAVTFKAWDEFTDANWTGTNGTKTDTTLAFAESPFSAVSDTADITVDPVNDAPVNTAPGAIGAMEDVAFDFTGGNAVSIADIDAGLSPLSVTMTVGNGDILFTAGTTGLAGDVDGTDGTVSFTGTLANINAALAGLRYLGNPDFSGADTLTITTNDQGATGADPGMTGGPADEQDVDVVNITVTGDNDSPTLNAAATPVLMAVNEDAAAPVGAVGTAVSALVDLTGGGGLDNVTDPDGPALGLAVTALDTTNGQWWFSTNNGGTWSLVGAVSDTNALLLSATNGRLYFDPTTPNFNGTIANAVTFKAWDQFTNVDWTGTNGNKTDTTLPAAESPFSATPDSANITVTAVNDAPVNTAPASVNALEDIAFDFMGGNAVSIADLDAGVSALSVTMTVGNGDILFTAGTTGLAGDVDGTDGTVSFTGNLTNINNALAGLRYLGNNGFSGVDTLTITTSDQGATGLDPGLTGGPADEQDVDAITINVAGLNDTPVLNAAATPMLAAVNEDAGAPVGAVGTAVSALVDLTGGGGLDNVTDPDGPGLGIAITNLETANGQWWFSTNGGTNWSLVGAVSDTNALLVNAAAGRLHFQPNANFNGTIANAVTFKAWDTFTGTNGTKTDTTLGGLESAFSAATDTANITVNSINDAPVNTAPASINATEDTPFDFLAGNAVSIADVDVGASALSVTMAVGNGDILFTAGTAGLAGDLDGTDGMVNFTGSLANINAALAGLRYLGNTDFSGADTLTITTNDQGFTGADPGLTGGPADEQDVDVVNITVTGDNDSPTLNAAATPVLASVAEDAGTPTGAVGTAVSALVDLTGGGGLDNVTDPDGPALGIAVTALDTANGQWWFSTNNGGTWSLVGAVSATNALLLSATNGRLYFQPNANFNGAVANAVTFKAWDQFTNVNWTGTNGNKTDTTLAFAESPFSATMDSANITVTAVNDAPVNTAPAAINATEDMAFDFTGGNAVSIADVDAGVSALSVTMTVANGDILFTAGTTGLTGDVNGTDGAVSFTGTLANINAALAGLRYLGNPDFSGADTLTITTNDQGATGADPGMTGGPADEQDVDVVNITVTGDNDTPVLNAAATPVLMAVAEDAAAPSGAVGTAVSALVDLDTVGGGLDNVTDPDGPALGIAITNLETANGQWWFSTNGGTSWSLVGAVSDTNALLLSATAGRLYFDPTTPHFNGTIANAVTFKAWDQFTNVNWTGTNGTKTDTTLAFGQSPFSATPDSANITVTAVNDAPVNTAPAAIGAMEDVTFSFTGGNAVSIADVDVGLSPLSVTMTVTNGDILFSAGTTGLAGDVDGTDGAVSFTGTLSDINSALAGLQYRGNPNFSGADTLTITTNDQGATGADPGLTGGPADEQDVDIVNITVTGDNDSPTLNAAATPVLVAVAEDAAAPVGAVGTAVSALADLTGGGGLNNVTDPDGPGLGIAITALNATNGQWWFSTNNGGTWSLVGAVSDTNALLLSATAGRLYFDPTTPNFNGTIANAVTFKAWDQFTNVNWTGTNGNKTDTTLAFAESPFSATPDSANITVTAVNDAPVNMAPAAIGALEDVTFSFTGGNAVSIADVDAGASALSMTMTVTNGDILFSAGTTGLAGDVDGSDGSVSFTGTLTNINNALAGLQYRGNPNFSGADTLTITTNDQGATGADPGLTGGPADEQDVDVVNITVTGDNDSPTLNAAATPVLAAVNEDAAAPVGAVGTAVSALVDLDTVGGGLDNVTDPDGPALGIAITNLETANGQWWFSTNNGGTWSLVGAVSDTNALLLSATAGRLYFDPTTPNFNGTIANAVTFKAWDQFTNVNWTGTNGNKTDTTLAFAESPFSATPDSANITVTAVNDAPVNTAPASVNALEDIAFDFTGGNAVSIADVDAGVSALSVTMTVGNGDILFTAGTTGLTGDVDGTDGTVSFTGNLTNINNALAGLRYLGDTDFSGVDTLTITTSDQGATGLDPGLTGGPADEQDVDAITINVAGLNDTPVLNAAATPVLAAVNEDAAAPSGAVGTAVSALVDLTGGGGLDNVTDGDGPALGIAITALDTTNGQWWFSTNGGTNWSLVGAVSATNALLLSATAGRLYFDPTTLNFNGTIANAVTFKAWDQFTNVNWTGTNGTKADTTLGFMESPFSTATDTANITVTAQNDGPVNQIQSAAESVNEDTPLTFNAANSNLIQIADPDAGAAPINLVMTVGNGTLTLASVVGLGGSADADGNDGTLNLTGTLANLNAALNGLQYQGNPGFSGADTLNITVDDLGNTGAGGALQDMDSVAITVTGVNDTPALNAGATPVLVSVNEDGPAPVGAVGTAVSALVDLDTVGGGLDNVTDPDGPSLGIAITALNTTNGQWWFSTNNGASWSLVGAVSATNALLLSGSGGRLYFDPTTPNFNGTIASAVTFKAWDQFTNVNWTGTNGNKTDTTLAFAESPFSTATDTANITVTAVNDAPVNTSASGFGGESVAEAMALTFTGANAITVSDVDIGAGLFAMTLTATNGVINLGGTGGLVGLAGDGTSNVTFQGTKANVDAALNNMTYTGNTGFSGAATLTVTTSDQGATGTGGTLQDVDVISITVTGVNDTPVLNAGATPVLVSVNEDGPAPVGAVGTAVSALVDLDTVGGGLDNVTDADGPSLGIAITALNTANGQWWFSTNNGASWSLVGAVSATNALLLSATNGRLYFDPTTPNFNGTIASAVTFKAWDQFTNVNWTGTNGNKTDTTLAFAESPFSTATDTANITVTAVNDAPVNTSASGFGGETVAEAMALTFTGANAITVSDVDIGAGLFAMTLTATNGVINLGGTGGLVGLAGDGTSNVTFQGTKANVDAALNNMTYTGNTGFSGAATLTVTTSDQGATGTGGTLQDVDVISITVTGVNDTPVLNAGATPVLVSVNEDGPAPVGAVGTAVSALVDLDTVGGGLDNVTDADGPSLGIAITALNTANGQWWFSTNNGASWSLVGAVSATNALLLSATNGRLYFDPTTPNFNGTIASAVTFKAWDQFTNVNWTGTNGNKTDTTLAFAESPFSAATDTADITVTAVNDAPVNASASGFGGETVAEAMALTFSVIDGNAITVSDVDIGAGLFAMTLTATNGVIDLGGTGGLVGLAGDGTSNVTFQGTKANVDAALDGMMYTGNTGFSGAATLTVTTSDQGATGTGGTLQDVDVISITVTGVNDTPALNAGATPVLVSVNEDGPAPVGAVGTAVTALADLIGGGGLNNVTDPDGPGLGIAITNLNTANGQWWFSTNNGASWSLVGAVSATNALLLSGSGGRLYFDPTTPNFNGTIASAVTFKAWDQFANVNWTGTNGNKTDTTLAFAESPFSTATDTADITVNAVNDAPVNASASGFAGRSVGEDMPLVFSGAHALTVSDVDIGAGLFSMTLGVNNGTLTLGAVGGLVGLAGNGTNSVTFQGTKANVDAALNNLTYQGNLNFSGGDTLTITTNDQGATGSGGAMQDVDTVAITVTPVNDFPTLNAAVNPVTVNVTENDPAPSGTVGTLVSSLVDLVGGGGVNNVTDIDGPGLGIAITAVDETNGTWFYSINNGSTWTPVGVVSAASALLVSATNGRVYFQPDPAFNGTVTNALTFRAWDQATGTNGTKVNTAGAGTGASPFSAATDAVDQVVDAAGGGAIIDTVTLNSLDGTEGLKLNGIRGSTTPGFGDVLGFDIAGVGDVNADGRPDLIVGARDGERPVDSQSLNTGAAFVVFGDTTANLATLANGTTGFNLALLNGSQGIDMFGPNGSAQFSSSLSGGGDFNGDGISDLLGGERNFGGGDSRAYVLYGDSALNGSSANDFGDLDGLIVSSLSGTVDVNGDGLDDGAEFDGLASVTFPTAVGNAGDVDNDGIDDMIFGNADRDTNGTDSGEAFLVFGNSAASLDALNPLGGANGSAVLAFEGNGASIFAGRGVAGIGDIDNDGFDDFAIGATSTSTDGKVYVIFGDSRANLATLSSNVDTLGIENVLNGANGFVMDNPAFAIFGNMQIGQYISGIGDFNGDMIDDFAVTSPELGLAYVVYGKMGGFSAVVDLEDVMLNQNGGFGIAGGITDIGAAGDVNGDGLADIVMGSPNASKAFILFGTTNVTPLLTTVPAFGIDAVDLTDGASFNGGGQQLLPGGSLHGAGVLLDGIGGTSVGSSVDGIGDFNGDGFDDVAVGAINANPATASGNPAGQAYVVYGRDFSGGGAPCVMITASANGEILRGDVDVDTLSSGGFTNVGHIGGAGNDVLRVNGSEFGVDGGGGTDVLTPDAAGITLDFDALTNKNVFRNIEQIQLDGFGANTLRLDVRDVLDMTGTLDELLVTGEAGDVVESVGQGWTAAGTDSRNVLIDDSGLTELVTFNVYANTSTNAMLLIDQDVTQGLIS